MKYFDFQEKVTHGSACFPFAYYFVNQNHPRYDMAPHWHKECELIRIVSGSLNTHINGAVYELEEGDIVFLNSGLIHSGIPVNCVYECVVFDITSLLQKNPLGNAELNDLIEFKKEIQTIYRNPDDDAYKVLFRIFEIIRDKRAGYQLQIYGALYYFLGLVEEHQLYNQEHAMNTINKKLLSKIKEVFFFIEMRYMDQITLEEMAGVLNLSEKYFCKFFKELTQKSPIEYLNWYRIQCARSMIRSSRKSMTDIAFSCGFNDTSYFTKVFKKYSDMTPRQYARVAAKEDSDSQIQERAFIDSLESRHSIINSESGLPNSKAAKPQVLPKSQEDINQLNIAALEVKPGQLDETQIRLNRTKQIEQDRASIFDSKTRTKPEEKVISKPLKEEKSNTSYLAKGGSAIGEIRGNTPTKATTLAALAGEENYYEHKAR